MPYAAVPSWGSGPDSGIYLLLNEALSVKILQ